jgi:uncharacterized damage-inducible protein DinB
VEDRPARGDPAADDNRRPAMELRTEALDTLDATRRFFDRTTRCLDESDSTFRATEATMTVASHVAHVAQVAEWFHAGVFDGHWNMDIAGQQAITDRVASLAEARAWLDRAWSGLRTRVESASEEELAEILPDNPILPGVPRVHIAAALADHVAHHRGALAVYARLAGKVPEMPYADD